MKFAAFVIGCVLSAWLVPPAEAQQNTPIQIVPRSSPWWVTGEFGAGQINLNADQQRKSKDNRCVGFCRWVSAHQLAARWFAFEWMALAGVGPEQSNRRRECE